MPQTTLAHRVWPVSEDANFVRYIVLALAGTLAVAIAAHIKVTIPSIPPINMTLQTLAVLAIGAAFGPRLGAATMMLYAAEGAVGLPVFSPTPDGYPGIVGPTGGYIVGFVFAAFVVGYLAERGWDRSLPKMLVVTLLGASVLYIPGLLWLQTFVGGMGKAIEYGLMPFWIGDVVKAAVVALGFPAIWGLLGRFGPRSH